MLKLLQKRSQFIDYRRRTHDLQIVSVQGSEAFHRIPLDVRLGRKLPEYTDRVPATEGEQFAWELAAEKPLQDAWIVEKNGLNFRHGHDHLHGHVGGHALDQLLRTLPAFPD